MSTDTASPDVTAILEAAAATSAKYRVEFAEVLTWRIEDVKKQESRARRLVTIRSHKLASQERGFHSHLEPRAAGYQQAALDARREQFAEAVSTLAAAAHALADTEVAVEHALGVVGKGA